MSNIAAVETNPTSFISGFATGGVWKSTNNGTTFQPIFETYSTASIGDIAIAPSDPNIVWVGTGEANNRQSSSFGDGIYKSTDAGKTFKKMGLEDSQTIARIVIDPKDPNVVYVAVLGHLFGPNKERGIYKTVDGGKTWTNVKFIDEDTGFTDLVIDHSDPKTLYAASYQRRRTSWGFNGGGHGSGLWKTVDAGKTWKKLEGGGLRRTSRSNRNRRCAIESNILYAQMEVGASTGIGGEEQTGGGQAAPSPSPSPYLSDSAASPTPTPGSKSRASGVLTTKEKHGALSAMKKSAVYYSRFALTRRILKTFSSVDSISVSRRMAARRSSRCNRHSHSDHHAIC